VLLDLQIVEALAFLLGELHVADVFLVQRIELSVGRVHRRGETDAIEFDCSCSDTICCWRSAPRSLSVFASPCTPVSCEMISL
jgi:hypothetical protein